MNANDHKHEVSKARQHGATIRVANCFACEKRAEEWCSLGDDLTILNETKICNTYHPGQVIFYQGNPCLGLYCIEEGTVVLRKTDAQGNEVIVRIANEGHTLGYRSFFAEGEYTASAEALTPCRVCFIDRAAIKELMVRNPNVAVAFLRRISDDLRRAEEAKLQFATLPVRARLANLLLMLKEHYGEVDPKGTLNIQLPLSRQDMASMIATRPETLSRTIRSLENDGVVAFQKRAVLIYDLDVLMDEAEMWEV